MIGKDSPFGSLMAEAVKLKGAQQAQLRPIWDGWPQYFQHSMFMQENVLEARTKSFEDKMKIAAEFKTQGNGHFAKQEYEEAVAQYEKALAIFKYCENTDPDWKKKGIRDDDIRVVDYKAEDIVDQNSLENLKVSLYLNISVCKLRMKEFAVAITACGDALAIDPSNAKAYYRRAQALITPLSSGAVEFEKALADLELACHYDPENLECRKLYRRLREEQAKQRKLDKATFSGMFNRGTVVDDTPEDNSHMTETEKAKADRKRLEKEVEDAEAIAHAYEKNGNHKQAAELREKIEQAKKATRSTPARVDFFNPTPEMIADGKKNGIDLTDRRVQQMLSDLQDEHLSKGTVPKQVKEEDYQASPSTKFQAALIEADEILPTMSNEEISQLLKSEGIDFHSITQKEQLHETVRNVLATKLCDMPRPGEPQTKDDSSKSMKHIFAFIGIWVLFRMYSSGGFTMLFQGFQGLLSGEPAPVATTSASNGFDDFDDF